MVDAGSRIPSEPASESARDIARRNQPDPERPLSPVMKTAATARELALCARGKGKSGTAG